ncbi:hypothetical protein [Lichenicoccus roseus]|uniref:hypothetical protein n=1 Tax=Lichenicoccus roseus TaxID=2683649 RepID=UPI0014867849|nr:hypothetical protein [Lichenicoccus roseus]
MFRKLFALETAALMSNDEFAGRAERSESERPASIREVVSSRTGSYGSMWNARSFN